MSWQQDGFLVLSDAGVPLYHGFFTTRWEAENKLKEVQALPEAELKNGATIVPARLWFDWRGTPKPSPRMETLVGHVNPSPDAAAPAMPAADKRGSGVAHEPVWHIQGAKDCEKCRGAGWLYGRELNNPSDDTYDDTMTKYSCDGPKCVALNR
jgi:hypothetical protein